MSAVLPRRSRTKRLDDLTLASIILASGAVAPAIDFRGTCDRETARDVLGDAVERLLAILDAIEGDSDLEPSLGWQPSSGHSGLVDLEGDDYDLEPSGDENEPSLGSLDRAADQRRWSECRAFNPTGDLELDRADYGDGGDREPNDGIDSE